MDLLGLKEIEEKTFVLNEISKYLFEQPIVGNQKKGEKCFDINYDYRYYYSDFLKYNIDLNIDIVSWWKFDRVLNAILNDSNSNIAKIIEFRTYKKPNKDLKARENAEHNYRIKMKQKYALPNNYGQTNNGFSKLWGYLEKKVGEQKEEKSKT